MKKYNLKIVDSDIDDNSISFPQDILNEWKDYRAAYEKILDLTKREQEIIFVVQDPFEVSESSFIHHSGWSAFISILIVSLPQISWEIPYPTISANATKVQKNIYELIRRHLRNKIEDLGSQLFDGLGLRSLIQQNLFADQNQEVLCKSTAIVIDDEKQIQNLNSLAAYSLGFNVFTITNAKQAQLLLGNSAKLIHSQSGCSQKSLSLEDIFLDFHDEFYDQPLSLEEREKSLPFLGNANNIRKLVSIGKPDNQNTESYSKPLGDFYYMWLEMNLGEHFSEEKMRRVNVGDSQLRQNSKRPHSAPARLVDMIELILETSRKNQTADDPILKLLHDAIVSRDMRFILHGRSPMLALELLFIQHVSEVELLSLMIASRSRIGIAPRIQEIKKSLEEIARPIPKTQRRAFILNASVRIFSRIRTLLLQRGLTYDAAECKSSAANCRTEITKGLFFKTWKETKPKLSRLYNGKLITLGGLWLFTKMTESTRKFASIVVFSFLAFVLAFFLIIPDCGVKGVGKAIDLTANAFFTVGLPKFDEHSWITLFVSYIASLIGLLYFGILISLVYSFIDDRR